MPCSWSERARNRQLPSPRVSAAYNPRARSCCVSCCVFSVGSERSCDGCGMSESSDGSAYTGGHTRALEDLVVRERTDDKRATTDSSVSDDLAHATPTHWAVDPLLLPSASWTRACEELYVYLDSGFAKQIIEHGHPGSWGERSGVRAVQERSRDPGHPGHHPPYIIRYDSVICNDRRSPRSLPLAVPFRSSRSL